MPAENPEEEVPIVVRKSLAKYAPLHMPVSEMEKEQLPHDAKEAAPAPAQEENIFEPAAEILAENADLTEGEIIIPEKLEDYKVMPTSYFTDVETIWNDLKKHAESKVPLSGEFKDVKRDKFVSLFYFFLILKID